MTFVGKILVILIMAFALIFLGVSTVVFTTASNWKDKSTAQKTQINDLNKKNSDLDAKVKDAQTKLETAEKQHKTLLTERESRINELTKDVTEAEARMTEARAALETAQNNARTSLTEATLRKGEIDVLAETLLKAQLQANQFTGQNIELTDQIRVLEREKATAEQNARDLRNFSTKLMAWARSKGLNVNNIADFNGDSVPPTVEGKVVEINPTNKSMEISIGSNDGLKIGQEFSLFRTEPRAEYLGKVRIVTVYPNKAVADVIGRTVNGKKILEGDIVSSTFNTAR